MKNDEVNNARKKYNISILRQKELNDLYKQLKCLEQHAKVKKYFELKDKVNTLNNFSSNIMYDFNIVAKKTESSNNILVYMGNLEKVEDKYKYSEHGNFVLFWDLETCEDFVFLEEDVFKLQDKYIIINVPKEDEEKEINPYAKGFYKARGQFLDLLLKSSEPQEEVVKKFIKRK